MKSSLEIWWRAGVLAAIGVVAVVSQSGSQGAGRADAKMPTAKIGKGNLVKLEVAATPKQIQDGLMYRTSLPEDQGMVFLFHPVQRVKFWMYHTLIPLDMLFVKNGKIVTIFRDVPPCKSENPQDCPTYPAAENEMIEVSEVIELNGGYSKRHNVNEGDAVVYEMPLLQK